MSDFSSKKHHGLMEAYASIYTKEEVVEQEIQQEEFQINEEALYESIVDYLVEFGYASDEKKAEAMIPHLGERFVDSIAGHIIICEQFVNCVNSLVEEGYDLSSSTWNELYEDYTGHLNTVLSEEYGDLSEALPLAIPAAAAAAPYVLPAIGAVTYGLKGLMNARRQKTDPASERWLQTGSFAAKTQGPSQKEKADRARAAAEAKKKAEASAKTTQVTSPAAKPSPAESPAGPTPPEGPKGPGLFGKAKALVKQGLGLKPGQSATKELGKKLLVKGGEGIKALPGLATAPLKKGFWTGALRTLGAVELGSLAGRQGTSPTGATFGAAGNLLKGTGSAIQGAPKEVGAVKKGVEAYQKAKEEKPKEEAPKQRKLKFAPDGSVIGFED